MPDLRDFRPSPAEFAALLDEAKVRALVLREQAKREFAASVLAAARRLAGAVLSATRRHSGALVAAARCLPGTVLAARNTATRAPGTSFR
jgi:hypothetical protein